MIKNKQLRLKKSELAKSASLADAIAEAVGSHALRWYVAQVNDDEMLVEATLYAEGLTRFEKSGGEVNPGGKSAVLNIIPTGVGCSIGGYAGDAGPVTNLLATTADYLITHPNAVNGSDFINLEKGNVVYTEGSCLDLFCKGLVDLHLPYANRVGLVVENTSQQNLETVFNVVNAARAVHGVNITDVVITESSIGGRCVENGSGAFVGEVEHPEVLFDACAKLIAGGANAIAITSNPADLPLANYAKHFAGEYPNPVGGVEAVISFLVTNHFKVPAAHAPLINVKQLDLKNNVTDARGAAEISSTSGLACILIGLRRAPQITVHGGQRVKDVLSLNNVVAVVTPASCLGGVPVLYTRQLDIPVIAVHGNETILDVTHAKLGLDNVIEVQNYAEAAGIILALQHGISVESISRPLRTLRF